MKISSKKQNKVKAILCAVVCAMLCCSFATPVGVLAQAATSTYGEKFNDKTEISSSSEWIVSNGSSENGKAEFVLKDGAEGNKALKISATEGTSDPIKYGVKLKNSRSFDANRYYQLSVEAKADAGTKFAFGVSNSFDAEFEITASDDEWHTYFLYIETGVDVSKPNYNVELWLGSRAGTTSEGSVLFDDVDLSQLNYDEYKKATQTIDANEYVHSERKIEEAATSAGAISVGADKWTFSFENEATGLVENVASITKQNSEGQDVTTYPYSENWTPMVVYATNTLEAEATKDDTKVLKLESPSIALPAFGTYRISLFAKSISEKSYFKINVSTNEGPNATQATGSSGLASSTSATYTNGWTEYIFFVRAASNAGTTAKISIEIEQGSEVCFDNLVVQRVLYSTFKDGKNKIDLVPTIDKGVENGFFEIADDPEMKSPLSAYGWNKIGTEKDKATMGIVSLDNFDGSVLNGATKPVAFKVNNIEVEKQIGTAYAISAAEDSYAGIESTSIKITKSKTPYAILSVYIQTQSGAKATASLYSGTQKIAEVKNVTSDEWQQIKFFIKPNADMSLTLKISLGNEDEKCSGTLFVSAATCITTSEDMFNAAEANDFTQIFDQSPFFAHTSILDKGVYEPLNFTIETNKDDAGAVGGILDMSSVGTNPTFGSFASNFSSNDKGEVLALLNTIDGTSKITHKKGITNTTTGYVKVSFKVKLVDVTGNVVVSLGEKLGDFALTQEDMASSQDGWIVCTMFVKTGSNTIGTINSVLSLENAGLVVMDELTTKSVSEDDYIKALSKTSATTKTIDLSTQLVSKETKKNSIASNPTAIFFIVLSSLILVGVVLFVLLSRAVKKLPNRTIVNLPSNGKSNSSKNKSKSNNDKGFV